MARAASCLRDGASMEGDRGTEGDTLPLPAQRHFLSGVGGWWRASFGLLGSFWERGSQEQQKAAELLRNCWQSTEGPVEGCCGWLTGR